MTWSDMVLSSSPSLAETATLNDPLLPLTTSETVNPSETSAICHPCPTGPGVNEDTTFTVYSPPWTGTSKEAGVTAKNQLELSGVLSVTVMVSVTSRHR